MSDASLLVKKIILWRIISIALTYLAIFLFTGDVKSATWFTLFLHLLLTIANYIFEILWDKYEQNRD
jgi:uncharacterized membrane protein